MGLPGVTIGRPNFRDGPGLQSNIHRWIEAGTKVDVLGHQDDYFEVMIGHEKGWLHRNHVVPETELNSEVPIAATAASSGMPGITVQRPNFRDGPSLQSNIIRMLQPNTRLQVLRREGDYWEVLIGEERGFVSVELVVPWDGREPEPPPGAETGQPATTTTTAASTTGAQPSGAAIGGPAGFLRAEPAFAGVALEPHNRAPGGSSEANIWNNYGGLLSALATHTGIDPAVAVAVLTHESGGRAFGGNGKLLIRFENHLFWEEWGAANQDAFHQHFAIGSPSWTGHFWRTSAAAEWRDFHGNNAAEWEVLDFACTLDERVAMRSMSMGLTQILGRNYGIVGYHNVQDMVRAFSQDVRAHILGFFDFVRSNNGVGLLQANDFGGFARMYNGPGQVERYRGLIAGSVANCHALGI